MNIAENTKKPSVAAKNIKSFIESTKAQRLDPLRTRLEPLGLDQRVKQICEQPHREDAHQPRHCVSGHGSSRGVL